MKKAARVTLLDASDLDDETHRVLKDQLSKATKFLPINVLVKWDAEIDALLRLAIWRLSVCNHKATFGQQLLNISYGSNLSKTKARLLVISTVFCSYFKTKISNMTIRSSPHICSEDETARLYHLLEHLKKGLTVMETVICMASFLNLIVFLREGRYPTLIDRILGLEPAVGSSQSRSIGYRYMTRELLWHGFMELITFTLPLVNFRYFKRKLISLIYTDKNSMKSCRFDGSRFELTLKTRCAICQQVPIRPHHISCRHVFCYYCIQSNFCADQNFECPECGQLVNGEIQSCC
ncbi:peroxisome biogenesis factor 2 isoform X1 [Nilaparvata lugens]|uniref:peroxisome biogenesis factor 2 isoform X1 n=1 Tax=Nilaparvata lugens TaxID=108931 RepID=UPI000B98DA96|nr:peroxisome biogenesis factor 2 isoform X1 [Nilaparvata lugens]